MINPHNRFTKKTDPAAAIRRRLSGSNETLAGSLTRAIAGHGTAVSPPTFWDRLDRYHEEMAEINQRAGERQAQTEQPVHQAPESVADLLRSAIAGQSSGNGATPPIALNSADILRRALGAR